jgi:HEPN domain-containing protein
MPAESFSDAAARHLDDAILLNSQERFDNAAYLSGYVVECAMKAVLSASPVTPQRLGHELQTISVEAMHLLWIVAPAMRRYEMPASRDVDSLMRDWSPDLRYAASGAFDSVRTEGWMSGARHVFESFVVSSVLDGWSRLQ